VGAGEASVLRRAMKRANWNHVMAWTTMFAIFGTGSVRAGTNAWTSIGPESGEIQALSVDPHNPRTLYAATDPGGAFKSLDGGASWVKSGGPNTPLVFDPQDPNTIYAIPSCTGEGISKSTDGGKSWYPKNWGQPSVVCALAIDPLNASTFYAGTSRGIFKSTDGGTNWSSASSGLPPHQSNPDAYGGGVLSVVIDPQNPSTLYAVVYALPGDLLLKSTDGGGSWNPVGSGLPESGIVLAIDPQNPSTLYRGTYHGIFKSTDGGAGWSQVNSGLPPLPWADSVVIDPQQPDTVYAAISNLSGDRVFKTTNGGASWSDASSGLPEGTSVRSLQIDPQIPTTLYAGTSSAGVFKSTDGGTSWAAINSGLTATLIYDVATDPRDSNIIYAGTSNGLVKTTDGGTNWSSANSGLAKCCGSPLAIDPQNTSTVFVAACAASGSRASSCGVFKSTDGGTSWSASWIAHSDSNWITAIAIDPRNSNIVYATTQGWQGGYCATETLHKSVDGGMSWSDSLFQNIGVLDEIGTMSCVLALAVDPQNSGHLYAAFQDGGVFKSTDAGATWHAANSGLSPIPFPLNPGYHPYYAVALAIDPGSPSTVYTVSFSGVFKSSDGAAIA
jgi:photosystem II stability/assembly factor-like uncharacterized protein